MKMTNHKGFSLIELVMVIVLFGIISVVVARMYSQALIANQTEQNVTDAIWQAQVALQRMEIHIRQIRTAADISVMATNRLTFTDVSGNNVDYVLSGNILQRNGNPLADGINSLTFSYYDAFGASTASAATVSYIGVSLNVTQKNTNYTIATRIYLRSIF